MRNRFLTILTVLLLALPSAYGLVVVDLVNLSDGLTSVETYPGLTISLATLLSTAVSEPVGVLQYSISLTTSDWTLSNRNYSTNGWDNDDGTGSDFSSPSEASAWNTTVSSFTFNTARADSDQISGNGLTVETFDLTIPLSTTLDTYVITLTPVYAAGAGGTPDLSGSLAGAVQFDVIIVPEPASLILLGGALAAVGLRRRPRKRSNA